MTLQEYLRDFHVRFERPLRASVNLQHRYTPDLLRAMRYTLEAGGKRIRPAVIELWARAGSHADGADVLKAGIAVELVHTCSLILDDLPSMDDAGTRRGRPCCHVAFGADTAILAAVAQLMLAFELAAQLDAKHGSLRSCALLSAAVGAEGMVGGQHVDLRLPAADRGFESLEYIHSHKTGVLFEAAARIGARLGHASEKLEAAAIVYARNLGLAFQIKDDLLDATGHAEEMGKDARQDRGKPTFVSSLGSVESAEIMERLLETARQSVSDVPRVATLLRELCDFVGSRDR